jgi:hypothetical protein
MTEIIYTPGVCNIGKEEITRRKTVGWIGLIATIIVIVVLLLLHAPVIWRVVVFLPAFVAASGFVQTYFHFCVGFAQAGVFNVSDTVGTTQTVTDPVSKARDNKRKVELYLYILVIAIFVTALTFLL